MSVRLSFRSRVGSKAFANLPFIPRNPEDRGVADDDQEVIRERCSTRHWRTRIRQAILHQRCPIRLWI